jgi:hypothetical protein
MITLYLQLSLVIAIGLSLVYHQSIDRIIYDTLQKDADRAPVNVSHPGVIASIRLTGYLISTLVFAILWPVLLVLRQLPKP